ncbi:MAG TPA: hypothetical protein VI320_03260 [Terracidiphilus sp.]|jgi:hypothetical protein
MTEIIVAFRVPNLGPLCRVWFETGNPACPLECKWIELQESGADRTTTVAARPQTHRRCA